MWTFLRNLFSKKTDKPAIEVAVSDEQAINLPGNEIPNLEFYTAQSIGKVRMQNEDSLFANAFTLAGDAKLTQFGLFIIADGMGGHHHGEVASHLAITSVVSELFDKIHKPLINHIRDPFASVSLHELVHRAIKMAQATVLNAVPGAGTTLTLGIIFGNQVTIGHIGDSRCYLIPAQGDLRCLTSDHSLVNRLLELGQLTPAEAEKHPQKNVLYKAIGQKGDIEADVATFPLSPGDKLLLCSDGLWGPIPDQEIQNIVNGNHTLKDASNGLIHSANAYGGPDNISLILVEIPQEIRNS